jgi:hypothetical protein
MQILDLNGIPLERTVFIRDLATGPELVNEYTMRKPNWNCERSGT